MTMPFTNYMTVIQKPFLSFSMRLVLVDWLMDWSYKLHIHRDTFFLSINYLDRFLSVIPIHRHRLQLLGLTCLLIAAKFNEQNHPEIEELIDAADGSFCKAEMLKMEEYVLNALSFKV
jgi:cyclin A